MISIPGFKLYKAKKSACDYGYLYHKTVTLPFSRFPKRRLHVWLPEDYDNKKRYGVIYFADAQNMVDKYLTLYGEWNMEDHIHNRMTNGYQGYILAGLDCPYSGREREREYTPYTPTSKIFTKNKKIKTVFGDKYGEFMVKQIKPLIDKNFKTKPDLTGFCGSSMGGLISSYMGYKYPSVFKFIISYSPAYFCYRINEIKAFFKEWKPSQDTSPIFMIYIGKGDALENQLFPATDLVVNLFRKYGFDDKHLYYSINKKEIHHEKAWSNEMKKTLKFMASIGY